LDQDLLSVRVLHSAPRGRKRELPERLPFPAAGISEQPGDADALKIQQIHPTLHAPLHEGQARVKGTDLCHLLEAGERAYNGLENHLRDPEGELGIL